MSSGDAGLAIRIEFGGGAELLFDRKKRHDVNLPGSEDWTLRKLLHWIRDNLLTEREELFLQDDTVRPGILVLVNDADWELLMLAPKRHAIGAGARDINDRTRPNKQCVRLARECTQAYNLVSFYIGKHLEHFQKVEN